jgi:hypothetical protein
MRRVRFHILILLLGGVITGRAAHADPWPDYDSQTDEVDYVEIIANLSGGIWTYKMTVVPGATDPDRGNLTIDGVKALAVYPTPLPDKQWAPENYAALRDGWDLDGGWEGKAFGYLTGPPDYYVGCYQAWYRQDIGTVRYPAPPHELTSQNFLVHVSLGNGACTFWARPTGAGIVLEPSSLLALAVGLTSLGGFAMRRRQRA